MSSHTLTGQLVPCSCNASPLDLEQRILVKLLWFATLGATVRDMVLSCSDKLNLKGQSVGQRQMLWLARRLNEQSDDQLKDYEYCRYPESVGGSITTFARQTVPIIVQTVEIPSCWRRSLP